MSDITNILRHCGDMGEGDDWVKRLDRLNLAYDIMELHRLAFVEALGEVEADMPQALRLRLGDAIKRATVKADTEALELSTAFAERSWVESVKGIEGLSNV